MKKTLHLGLALAFYSTLMPAHPSPKPADFSGNWVLDFSQTKNPPAGLENYVMLVKQDERQLNVETTLKGNLQAADSSNGQYPGSGGGYPGRSPGGYPGGAGGGMGGRGGGGGMGMPGRIGVGNDMPGGMGIPDSGMPGSGGGRPRSEGRSQGYVAAYKLYPQHAVYKLDGTESTAQLGDPAQTDATSKTDWVKNGEVLKLTLTGTEDTGGRAGKIQLKDQWKLSDDGKLLMVERSVHSREGSGSVHLVFRKETADVNIDAPGSKN